MSDKSQTPTGVFVRLPLSDNEKMALTSGVKMGGSIEQGLLAVGTPVAGGDLHEVGIEVVHTHGSDLTYCRDHAQKIANGADGIIYSLVRQSDHQAALAAAQAEIVRLREALQEQQTFHECEDKALSKQPPSSQGSWRRNQHQEQIELIEKPLKGPEA